MHAFCRAALACALALAFAPAGTGAAPLDRAAALARALAVAPEGAAVRETAGDAARLRDGAGARPHAPRLELEAQGDGAGPFGADARTLRLGFAQELDVRGVRGARRDRATAELGQIAAVDDVHLRDVALRVESAYGALLVARRRAALADTTAAGSARIVHAARRAARGEALSPYALRQIERADAEARAHQASARGDAARAEAELRGLIGGAGDEALELRDDLGGGAWACAAESLTAVALDHRPEVRLARADEALVAADTRVAVREGRPGPEVGLFVERTRDGAERDEIGATVSVPLPFARPERADEARGALGLARARAARQRAESNVRSEVRGACAAVTAAEEGASIRASALVAAAEDRARLESAYREGRLDLDAYLTQRERLVDGANAALDALAALDAARVALAHATGFTTPALAAALAKAPEGATR